MAVDTNLNAYGFIKDFKASLGEKLQERLESGELFPVLQEGGAHQPHHISKIKYSTYNVGNGTVHHIAVTHRNGQKHTFQSTDKQKVIDHTRGYAGEHHKVDWNNPLKEEVEFETIEALEEHVRKDTMDADWTQMGEIEKDVVLKIRTLGKQLGSDEGAYASGVLCLTFKNKQAVEDFAVFLEDEDNVDTYEIEAVREDLVGGFVEDQEYDFGDIMFDKDFEFNVYIYINTDIVMLPAEELEVGDEFEWDDEEDNGFITEVKRKIKVNFRGKKRIKMQCSPGFKWDGSAKTCKKISGAQVAVMRKAMRRAVLTKKSMGQSFKARVVRKARKANRFRKSYGLN